MLHCTYFCALQQQRAASAVEPGSRADWTWRISEWLELAERLRVFRRTAALGRSGWQELR
jgi:hypothetical protein